MKHKIKQTCNDCKYFIVYGEKHLGEVDCEKFDSFDFPQYFISYNSPNHCKHYKKKQEEKQVTWLQKEYQKCRQFCKTYQEYERIKNLTRYEPKLKTKQTQLKLELLRILENIIDER